jgi:hypothetical protein
MTLGELAQVLSFSFDNQFAYPGTIKTTSIDSNVITEKLTYKSTGALLAQQTTTKNADGSITEAQTVYNTDGTVFRDVTATTTLVGGMPQTEVKSV